MVLEGMNFEGFAQRGSMAPAVMGPKTEQAQLQKLGEPTGELPPNAYVALRMVGELLEQYIPPCVHLTDEETLFGKKDEEGELQPMELSTSAGYLFSNRGKKRAWVYEHRHVWDEYLKADWESLQEHGSMPYQWIWRLSQKMELRDIERVLNGKTRLFCAAPFPILYHGRKLFGDFTRKFYKAQQSMSFMSSVGINIFDGNWHRMIQYLTNGFENLDGSEGDVSGMDKKTSAEILALIGEEIIMRFYAPEDHHVMRRHWHRYVEKIVVDIYGNIRVFGQGNPSGGPETVVINTILTMWMAMFVRVEKFGITSVRALENDLRDKCYGDDVFSFHEYIRFADWQAAARAFGFEYTGKDGSLTTMQFLGRKTIIADGLCLPTLSADRILSILEWNKTGDNDPVARYQRITSAHMNAFPLLFSDDMFDKQVYALTARYVKSTYDKYQKTLSVLQLREIPRPRTEKELAAFYTGFNGALALEIGKNLRLLNRKENFSTQKSP